MSINVSGYDGIINNLTVQANLTLSARLFAQYTYVNNQNFTGGGANTVVQYPTAVVQDNISKLTITNTNSRFQNTSGKVMYLFVNALLSPNNPIAATTRMSIRIVVNSAAQAIAANTVYFPASLAAPMSTSTILKLDVNDYFEVFLLNGAVQVVDGTTPVNATANNGSLAICQL